MSVLPEASILVDHLRGRQDTRLLLERERAVGVVHASAVTRPKVLAGTRPAEARATRQLFPAPRDVRHFPMSADVTDPY